jgi:hypothetical protein
MERVSSTCPAEKQADAVLVSLAAPEQVKATGGSAGRAMDMALKSQPGIDATRHYQPRTG